MRSGLHVYSLTLVVLFSLFAVVPSLQRWQWVTQDVNPGDTMGYYYHRDGLGRMWKKKKNKIKIN